MSEYIVREAAKKLIDNACAECREACEEFDGFYADCNQCLLHGVKNKLPHLPAANVREVVRGHWITEAEAEKMGGFPLPDTCSVCGHCDWDNTESKYFNFCPNCGADMREGE